MEEKLVVFVIVALSLAWIVRHLLNELRGASSPQSGGCDCPLRSHCGGTKKDSAHPASVDGGSRSARRSKATELSAVALALCTGAAAVAVAAEASVETPTEDAPKAAVTSALDELELDDHSERWWQQDRAFSSTFSDRLAAVGLELEAQATSEVFSCAYGGHRERGDTAVRGLVDLGLEVDLEQVAEWSGASIGLLAQHASGNGISDRAVGDRQVISNIDAHDFTKISELWLATPVSSRMRIKAGKLDANCDLAAIDHGEDFLNSSFGLIPTVPLPTYPYPALGAVVLAEASPRLSVAAGVFDGTPDVADGAVAFRLGGHSVSAVGVRYRGLTGTAAGDGVYRAGAWYHSADLPELTAKRSAGELPGNYGAWFSVDQPLLATANGRTLGTFAQLGWAPADRNELSAYVGCGVAIGAPFASRPDDGVGLGIAHARLSHHIRPYHSRGAETTVELYYRAQLLPWLAVQPDLQYVVAPDGRGEDTLAVGLRMHTSL